ncbi:MAG: hypothetical protein ACI31G_01340 [Bacilli bacterium]
MKTAIKVLTIISIVALSFSLGYMLIALIVSSSMKEFIMDVINQTMANDPSTAGVEVTEDIFNMVYGIVVVAMIISAICCVVGIVNDALILKKLKNGTTKKAMTAHAVLSIIFSNLVVGILLLVSKDSDLN